jgi:hypothetical protein
MQLNSSQPILFDRAAAAAILSEADTRAFLATQRVFISSYQMPFDPELPFVPTTN